MIVTLNGNKVRLRVVGKVRHDVVRRKEEPDRTVTSFAQLSLTLMLRLKACKSCRPSLVSKSSFWNSVKPNAHPTTPPTAQKRRRIDKWNYNPEISFVSDPGEHSSYALVTAKDLEDLTEPPKRVKMLVRDFIEDSLYNRNYGYFPKRANILSSPNEEAFSFNKIKDSAEFHATVAQRYADYGHDKPQGPGKQLWSTPTEMFKVYRVSLQVKRF